jgi:excisionase family DNA binding protein
MEHNFLTVAEIADDLKVNQQTVRNWIDRGELPAVRIGARRIRVTEEALERFIEAGSAPSDGGGRDADDREPGQAHEVEPEDGVIVSARQTFAEALAAVQEPRDDAELVPALEELARASTALVEALSGR